MKTPNKVWKLLSKPERWAQGWFAFNNIGASVYELDEEAVRWCLQGAINKVYNPKISTKIENEIALCKIIDAISFDDLFQDIEEWNDDPRRTWEEVYTLVKELDI